MMSCKSRRAQSTKKRNSGGSRMGFRYSFWCELLCFIGWSWGLSVSGRGAEIGELWQKKRWSAYHQNCCHTRCKCDSNFDSRHSIFFSAIIHLFLHPFLKQICLRITQWSTITHIKKSIKNPCVTHCYTLPPSLKHIHHWQRHGTMDSASTIAPLLLSMASTSNAPNPLYWPVYLSRWKW